MKRINALLVIAILLFSVAGCSSGGGGSSTPKLSFGVKQLLFNWSAVEGTDHYRILVDPDGVSGVSGFSVVPDAELISNTSTSHAVDVAVHLTDWFAAQYMVEACDDTLGSACKDISNVTLTPANAVAATGYFKASNAEFDNRFGHAVAVSSDGNTLAVGAYAEGSSATGIDGNQNQDANTAGWAGAVYIFSRDTAGSWSQQAYVKASNTDAGDQFGYAVALSGDGNTLAVGAWGEASSAKGMIGADQGDNTADGAGAVYVFSRGTGTTWSQQAYVKASNTDANDRFGWSVALSSDGNTLAVGADSEGSSATGIDGDQADNTAGGAGAAYVFSRGTGTTTWSQQAYVKASNTDAGDQFGHSVALSGDGNTLAVGAWDEDSIATGINGGPSDEADNALWRAGAVYVFSRGTGTTWSQQAYVKASNTGYVDEFGWSVALSSDGNTLAVGAKFEESIGTGVNSGYETDNSAIDAGAAYVFSRDQAGDWTQQAYVKASNTDLNHDYGNDEFGYAVTLSGDGNTLAVGAWFEDSKATGINGNQADNTATIAAGAAYVFSRTGTTWLQQAYVKASNTGSHDYFGSAMALNGDGTTLAVGAYDEYSGATGVGGNQKDNSWPGAGAVYLY